MPATKNPGKEGKRPASKNDTAAQPVRRETSPERQETVSRQLANNSAEPARKPHSKRFFCGVNGCQGGAYNFSELKRHYTKVHTDEPVPASAADVQTSDFLEWLRGGTYYLVVQKADTDMMQI